MRMKRLPAFTLGILAMIGMTEARSSVDDEKAVAALDTEYQAAVKNNDVPTMHRILAASGAIPRLLPLSYGPKEQRMASRSITSFGLAMSTSRLRKAGVMFSHKLPRAFQKLPAVNINFTRRRQQMATR